MILTDAPLNDVLRSVALLSTLTRKECVHDLLLDEEGLRLRFAAGPKLPDAYRVRDHGVHIGPEVGSCGAAAYLRKPVSVADVMTHPHFRWLQGFTCASRTTRRMVIPHYFSRTAKC